MRRRTSDKLSEFSELANDVSRVTKKALSLAKPRRVSSDRRRVRFSFWLEMDKVEHILLGNWIDDLKRKRQFAPIIRTALTIYQELKRGETAMLYHCFPDLKPKPVSPPPEIEQMQKKIDSLQDQVDLLKGILIKQSGPGAVDMTVKMSGVGVRTPRPQVYKPPVRVDAPVVDTEGILGAGVDTSTAFLDAF